MAQKKRISDEAFPWVKSTSEAAEKEEKKSPVKKTSVSTAKKKAAVPEKSTCTKRTTPAPKPVSAPATGKKNPESSVFVLYDKKGNIHSIVRMNRAYLPEGKIPFATTKDTRAAEVVIPEEFADMEMVEIHRRCVVRGTDSEPYLAKK